MQEAKIVCNVCGSDLPLFASRPYCFLHDPKFPIVEESHLPGLERVPRLYRHMVSQGLGRLYDFDCGDGYFLTIDRMTSGRSDFEALTDFSHLQPFGKGYGGDLWCWSTECLDVEPPIYHVEYWGAATPCAPDFERFMYRSAIEQASPGFFDSDRSPAQILLVATLLTEYGSSLGSDLLEVMSRPIQVAGFISVAERQERIRRFLGINFLPDENNQET